MLLFGANNQIANHQSENNPINSIDLLESAQGSFYTFQHRHHAKALPYNENRYNKKIILHFSRQDLFIIKMMIAALSYLLLYLSLLFY